MMTNIIPILMIKITELVSCLPTALHSETTTTASKLENLHQKLNCISTPKYLCQPPTPEDFDDNKSETSMAQDMPKSFNSIETNSYGSMCPEDFMCMCNKHPLALKNELPFFQNFKKNSNRFPINAILDLQVDLGVEHRILLYARGHTRENQVRKKGNHCFHKRDQAHIDTLTTLLKIWDDTVDKKKRRGKYFAAY